MLAQVERPDRQEQRGLQEQPEVVVVKVCRELVEMLALREQQVPAEQRGHQVLKVCRGLVGMRDRPGRRDLREQPVLREQRAVQEVKVCPV